MLALVLLLAGLQHAASSALAFAVPQSQVARSNDVVDRYELKENGDLFRYLGAHKCQITNNVHDILVAQHPTDVAMRECRSHSFPAPRAARARGTRGRCT
jgi:hypothetical protein